MTRETSNSGEVADTGESICLKSRRWARCFTALSIRTVRCRWCDGVAGSVLFRRKVTRPQRARRVRQQQPTVKLGHGEPGGGLACERGPQRGSRSGCSGRRGGI